MTVSVLVLVWKHLLLELGPPGALLLQALSRESPGVQGEEQAQQGDAPDVSGGPVLLHRHPKEKGRDDRPEEVHREAEEGKG